jgi:hypothetical protein
VKWTGVLTEQISAFNEDLVTLKSLSFIGVGIYIKKKQIGRTSVCGKII